METDAYQTGQRKPIRRKVVPGAMGIGRVEMIFKEKPPKKSKILAIILYSAFISMIYFSFGWSREYLKEKQLIPAVRFMIGLVDSAKLNFFTQVKTEKADFVVPNGGKVLRNSDNVAISAESLPELIFTQGYMHSVDRIFQMEIYRRAAYGTLSEIFGDKTLYFDKFSRIMKFYELAEDDYNSLSPELKQLLTTYVSGVNSYLEKETNFALPIDFQISYGLFELPKMAKWSVMDTLVITRLLLYEWNPSHWENQLLAYIAERHSGKGPKDTLLKNEKHPYFTQYKDFSRNLISFVESVSGTTIAVGSKFSPNSNAHLLSDFYSTNHQQGYWYSNEFFIPSERLELSGVSFPGIPFLFMGKHKSSISWTVQFQNFPSDQLYIVENPQVENQDKYDIRSEILTMDSSNENVVSFMNYEHKENHCRDIYQILDSGVYSTLASQGANYVFLCSLFPDKAAVNEKLSSNPLDLFFHLNFESFDQEKVSSHLLQDKQFLPMNLILAFNNGTVGLIGNELKRDIPDEFEEENSVKLISEDSWTAHVNGLRNNFEIFPKIHITDGFIISSDSSHLNRIETLLELPEVLKTSVDFCSNAEDQTCDSSASAVPFSLPKAERAFTDIYSSSAHNYSQFMTFVLTDIIANQQSLKYSFNLTDDTIVKLMTLKTKLQDFDGFPDMNNEQMIFIEGFRIIFLMKVLQPLIPSVDLFLGNNLTAISRSFAYSSSSSPYSLHRIRRTTDFIFNFLPPVTPVVSQQKSADRTNSLKKKNYQIIDVVQPNYWIKEMIRRRKHVYSRYRSSSSNDLESGSSEQFDNQDFLFYNNHNLRLFFTECFIDLFQWIDSVFQVPSSFIFNYGVRRRWGRVHSYHNLHAVSPVFEVFDTMVENGPMNRLTGNLDSLFATNYVANKFTFYNKRGFTCESQFFASLRMNTEIPNNGKPASKNSKVASRNSDQNSFGLKGSFILPNRPSSRSGSQFSGLNLDFFRTNVKI